MRHRLVRQISRLRGHPWVRSAGRLQLLHHVEWAEDANRLTAKVDRYRAHLHPGDVTHSIHVVTDQVVDRLMLDCWLGLGPKGATGEMSPPPCPG